MPPDRQGVKSVMFGGTMQRKKILLIRHGETDWNAERRWQGQYQDIPLNAAGRAQAQALARYLSAQPVDAIFSSDLIRTWETATILGAGLGITPQADSRWREVHVGLFQGHTGPELQTLYPDHWQAFSTRSNDYRFPEGESWQEVARRALAAFHELAAHPDYHSVAVVSHGGTLRTLLTELFQDSPEVNHLRFGNTSITTLRANGKGWELTEIGATPHLSASQPGNEDPRTDAK